jgi:hypothetical protein
MNDAANPRNLVARVGMASQNESKTRKTKIVLQMTESVALTVKDYRQSQPIDELRRKAAKAARPGWWTQEDIDLAKAEAKEMAEWFRWNHE